MLTKHCILSRHFGNILIEMMICFLTEKSAVISSSSSCGGLLFHFVLLHRL